MERRNRIGEYVEEMLQMGKIVDENKKNRRKKRIAVIVMLVVRSVYKELHADHETGAADNK